MCLLDTNIVSWLDPRRRERAASLLGWMRRNDRALALSAVTVIETLRDALMADFADRLPPIDIRIALAIARMADAARAAVIEWKDLLIAATGAAHGLTVLTGNLRHFQPTGVPALDPLMSRPPDAA